MIEVAGTTNDQDVSAEAVATFDQSAAHAAFSTIEPTRGWQFIPFKEVWRYRELAYFLCWRDVKVRYKQTVLGALWAIIQPLFSMIVFSIFFGRMAKVPSDGIPYPIFVYAGLLPWTYFANALRASGSSLVGGRNLITKVYFPRIIVPGAAALAGLVDLAIASVVLGGLMIYYRFIPGWGCLLFPYLVFFTFLTAVGFGLWLSALNVQYRDVQHAIPFFVQIGLFLTPVIYPVSILPDRWQWVLYLNPMAGLIENYRAGILGQTPVNWPALAVSTAVALLLFVSGAFYFRRMERTFADVI